MALHGITAKLEYDGEHVGFKDINFDDSFDTTEIRSRGWAYVRELIGQRKIALTVQVEAGSAAATAVRTNYNAKTSAKAILYDATTLAAGYGAGTQCVNVDMFVTKLSRTYPVNGEAVFDATFGIDAEGITDEDDIIIN